MSVRFSGHLTGLAMTALLATSHIAHAEDFTIAVGVRDPIYTHLYVALDKGMFEEAGCTPSLVVTGSGSRAAQLMATGQADITLGNPEHVLVIAREGRPTVMLAAVDQKNTFGNILVPSASTAEGLADLKGDSIGTTATGGGAYYYASYMLEQSGLGEGDYTWISLGPVNNILGALKSGRVQAAVASLSMIREATEAGYARVLFDSRDDAGWAEIFGGPMPSFVLYALKTNVDARPELYKCIVDGIAAADDFVQGNDAKTIAEAILPEMGGQSLEAVTEAVDVYKSNYWRTGGVQIRLDEYERWIEFVLGNRLYDESKVDEIRYDRLVADVGAFE